MSNLVRQVKFVLAQVVTQGISAHNIHNASKLVIVITAFKECVDLEQHASQCAAERPNIQRIVVKTVIDKELRALVVATGDAHVVFCVRHVIVCQTPID